MGDIVEFSGKNKRAAAVDTVRRDEAVEKVRGILLDLRMTECLACERTMALGDVLIPIRGAAGYGGWGEFLRDCGLSERDAQIAMQLARARPMIEAANPKRASGLSVRAALGLIRPKKTPRSQARPSQDGENKAVTLEVVLGWLKTAATSQEKRLIAVELAQDTELMRKILRMKPKATPEQIFRKAMGLLVPPEEDAPAVH